MKCGREITSAAMCNLFVEAFIEEFSGRLPDQEIKRILFVRDFALFLIEKKKFLLKGGWNSETQILLFSGKTKHSTVSKMSIRYESGIQPTCFWIDKDQTRANRFFNELQLEDCPEWTERTFLDYVKSV